MINYYIWKSGNYVSVYISTILYMVIRIFWFSGTVNSTNFHQGPKTNHKYYLVIICIPTYYNKFQAVIEL